MKQLTSPVTVPVSPCLSPEQVWQTLLTYLLNKHYGLTLDDTPFHDGNVINEHIEAGVPLVDTVNFLVEKYGLVRIDLKGLSWQEQSPYISVVDILRARRAAGLLKTNVK